MSRLKSVDEMLVHEEKEATGAAHGQGPPRQAMSARATAAREKRGRARFAPRTPPAVGADFAAAHPAFRPCVVTMERRGDYRVAVSHARRAYFFRRAGYG